MTGGGTALKDGGPSHFAANRSVLRTRVFLLKRDKIGSSAAASRRVFHASLTAAPPPGPQAMVPIPGRSIEEDSIRTNMMSTDRQLRFYVACETADFHWEARQDERWLGTYESLDVYEDELDRIAIIGSFAGRWFTGIALVDGNGAVHDIGGLMSFEGADDAHRSFEQLR